jgi:hypothetical protein
MNGTNVVYGPTGMFVVRAHRYGVPMEAMIWSSAWDLLSRIRRLVRREKRWVIRVCVASDDPFGPDIYSEVVIDKSVVHEAMSRVVAAVRRGVIAE